MYKNGRVVDDTSKRGERHHDSGFLAPHAPHCSSNNPEFDDPQFSQYHASGSGEPAPPQYVTLLERLVYETVALLAPQMGHWSHQSLLSAPHSLHFHISLKLDCTG